MKNYSRRNILKTGTVLAAGTAGIGTSARKVAAADRAGTKYNWGHTEDFGTQYYRRMTDILVKVRQNEMNLIGDLTSRMADAIKSGNEVWLQAGEGHMGRFENDETLPGNPRVIRSLKMHEWNRNEKERVARLKKGDVLMTNHVTGEIRAARDRGVYVIGVPVNYVDNEWTPRGFVNPNVNDWLLGDVSSVILQSYIPYHQGIVDCPEVPEMKICPSSANSLYSLYWMFQCEVAHKLKDNNAQHIDKSAVVLDTILERIHEAFHRQKDYMFDFAPEVAKRIGGGAHYHVTSDHPGVQEESNRVAMGPMITNAWREIIRFDGVKVGEDDMKKGDVHLLATIEPDSQKILEEAKKAKEMDMFIVSIAPGNSFQLRQYSDVFIDNMNPEGSGLMEIKEYDQKVGCIGSILNNTLMWIFTAQFIDEMVRRGWIPWFWLGYYQVGGKEYDLAVRPFFLKQGF
ncbi:MAG: hypothetical protein JXB48_20515 [Candidatus Latescibacteria bacterium]|nr:hypothetical protein [Candidatus Latescibacterota bacterium]